MKIQYKFGPRAGEIAHVPRSQEIQVLLNSGIIEEVALTDAEKRDAAQNAGHTLVPNYSEPVWSVVKDNTSNLVSVVRRHMSQTTYFNGVSRDLSAWPWRELTKQRAKELEEQFEAMLKNGGTRSDGMPFAGNGWRQRLPQ